MVSKWIEKRSSSKEVEFEPSAMTGQCFGGENELFSLNSLRPELRFL